MKRHCDELLSVAKIYHDTKEKFFVS